MSSDKIKTDFIARHVKNKNNEKNQPETFKLIIDKNKYVPESIQYIKTKKSINNYEIPTKVIFEGKEKIKTIEGKQELKDVKITQIRVNEDNQPFVFSELMWGMTFSKAEKVEHVIYIIDNWVVVDKSSDGTEEVRFVYYVTELLPGSVHCKEVKKTTKTIKGWLRDTSLDGFRREPGKPAKLRYDTFLRLTNELLEALIELKSKNIHLQSDLKVDTVEVTCVEKKKMAVTINTFGENKKVINPDHAQIGGEFESNKKTAPEIVLRSPHYKNEITKDPYTHSADIFARLAETWVQVLKNLKDLVF